MGEKALKAFLYAKGEELVVGHSIERLCTEAAKFDEKFLAARDAVGMAAEIVDFVRHRISKSGS